MVDKQNNLGSFQKRIVFRSTQYEDDRVIFNILVFQTPNECCVCPRMISIYTKISPNISRQKNTPSNARKCSSTLKIKRLLHPSIQFKTRPDQTRPSIYPPSPFAIPKTPRIIKDSTHPSQSHLNIPPLDIATASWHLAEMAVSQGSFTHEAAGHSPACLLSSAPSHSCTLLIISHSCTLLLSSPLSTSPPHSPTTPEPPQPQPQPPPPPPPSAHPPPP